MIVTLRFHSDREPSVELVAETDAERAILGFVAESTKRRWKCAHGFDYRPGGVERVVLEAEKSNNA